MMYLCLHLNPKKINVFVAWKTLHSLKQVSPFLSHTIFQNSMTFFLNKLLFFSLLYHVIYFKL